MFEKNLAMCLLLDFYGQMLTERKLTVMNLYYNEDLSLAEIASEVGISRQGVRELIKKSESELYVLEEKLRLASRFNLLRNLANDAEQSFANENLTELQRNSLDKLIEAVRK